MRIEQPGWPRSSTLASSSQSFLIERAAGAAPPSGTTRQGLLQHGWNVLAYPSNGGGGGHTVRRQNICNATIKVDIHSWGPHCHAKMEWGEPGLGRLISIWSSWPRCAIAEGTTDTETS